MGKLALSIFLLFLLHLSVEDKCVHNVVPWLPTVAAFSKRHASLPLADNPSLKNLVLEGQLSFSNLSAGAVDFGMLVSKLPAAILYPTSEKDIQDVARAVYDSDLKLTLAAKGPAHSCNGQAMARSGVVVEMSTLPSSIEIHAGAAGSQSYADVGGGQLWIELLEAALKVGLAPRSWTDYLYLSVGGTLSNAGISGQTFRHGPQISNVLALEVITGFGELVTCSATRNSQLFNAVLGGLGQFGIVTRARIILEPAPHRVRWIRALYSDFARFTKDQEALIAHPDRSPCGYVEGFVVLNSEDFVNGYNSILFQGNASIDPHLIPPSAGPVLYTIELGIYNTEHEGSSLDEKVSTVLASLGYIPGLLFTADVSYYDFLNRVRAVELALRAEGAWVVPHPWLNLFVPAKKIATFNDKVLTKLTSTSMNGPLLIYPVNQNKWRASSSAVTPKGATFYLVAFLQSANPSSPGLSSSELQAQNRIIRGYCEEELGCKSYLAPYKTQSQWRRHFGTKWTRFLERKHTYDPQAILSPGQNIFSRNQVPQPSFVSHHTLLD